MLRGLVLVYHPSSYSSRLDRYHSSLQTHNQLLQEGTYNWPYRGNDVNVFAFKVLFFLLQVVLNSRQHLLRPGQILVRFQFPFLTHENGPLIFDNGDEALHEARELPRQQSRVWEMEQPANTSHFLSISCMPA